MTSPYENNPDVSPNKLFGHFYGSGHVEVGGLFVTPTLAGAFGATRDEGVEK